MRAVRWVRWYVRELTTVLSLRHREGRPEGRCC